MEFQSVSENLIHLYDRYPIKETVRKDFSYILFNLFARLSPIQSEGEIVLSTYVLEDGRGDYHLSSALAKHIKKKFKERSVHLITVASKGHQPNLARLKSEIASHHLIYWGLARASTPSADKSTFPEKEEVSKRISSATVWIAGPVSFGKLQDDLVLNRQGYGVRLAEYDGDLLNCGKELNVDFFTGLGDQSHGIIFKNRKEHQWSALEHQWMKNILFGKESPTQQEIDRFQNENSLHVCYIREWGKIVQFIEDSITYNNIHLKKKVVNICLPGQETFSVRERTYQRMIEGLLSLPSVSKVTHESIERESHKSVNKESGDTEVRIIFPGDISPKDFKTLVGLSAPIAACKGDTSLSLMISYGKVPAYVGFGHKSALSHALMRRAEERFGEDSPLHQYLKSFCGSGVTKEKRLEALASNQLADQAEELSTYLRENWNLNETIKGLVNYSIFMNHDPMAATVIDRLKSKFHTSK